MNLARVRLAYVVMVAAALGYAGAVFAVAGKDAWRVLLNDPAFVPFHAVILPVAVALVAAKFDGRLLASLGSRWRAGALAVLLVLLMAVVAAAVADVTHVVQPERLRATMDGRPPLEVDREERRAARGKEMEEATLMQQRGARATAMGSFATAGEALSGPRSNVLPWLALGLNLVAGVFVACFFWYLLVMAVVRYYGGRVAVRGCEPLMLAWAMLLVWFPLRLYSEWYLSLYDRDQMVYAGWVLYAVLVVLGAGLLLVIFTPKKFLRVATAGYGLVGIVLSGLSLLKPDSFLQVMRAMDGLAASPATAGVLTLVMMLGVAAIAAVAVKGT